MKPRPTQALVLLLLTPATPALAESEACWMFPGGAEEYTCTCGPAPYPDAPGPMNDVWGSTPYSNDSDICRAALHAGVIGPEGGEVTAIWAQAPPWEDWRGSTRNGVTTLTHAWSWESAFTFEGAQAPEPLPICGPLGQEEELDCFCPHGGPRGQVWGSGPYTADSDICAAAYNAGVLDNHGGNVRVLRAPGQESYTASTGGGVTSAEHGPADASFSFGSFE